MKFSGLRQCIEYLRKEQQLLQIDDLVDPNLEMAEITRQVFNAKGPAILFTRVKNSHFPAVSNLFGTWERTLKIFEPQLSRVRALVDMVSDPPRLMREPAKTGKALTAGCHSLPIRVLRSDILANQCRIEDLPRIKCWPEDGGAFILLPQVFSKIPGDDSIFSSNLGMYRIQITGNDYQINKEAGIHYQIHRGIGNHHKAALEKGRPLYVSIFIGGPPAHTLAAVMPLPEGFPEIAFAGALGGRNFRYIKRDPYLISADADFCITGWIEPGKTKREGPFGDHLGYYSLEHEYPYLKVEKVYHRKEAVFPFTVVGRPPQEDTCFGRLIHEITRSAVQHRLPGVTAVNAVDDAGVHPLLLAKAHERYIPYEKRRPRELLTHASLILGTGQLSLAKYLLICAHEDNPNLDVNDEQAFFSHMLERVDFHSDLHFITKTTMDTLDYSTENINAGSKLVISAAGDKKRELSTQVPDMLMLPNGFSHPRIPSPGIIVVQGSAFISYPGASREFDLLKETLQPHGMFKTLPLMVVVDDTEFTARTFSNFLWITFLRSNPSHDIYGVNERFEFKHWRCAPPVIIDARIKPFHSKPLVTDRSVHDKVIKMAKKGGPLYGII